MGTKLFETKDVNKFFDLLLKQSREVDPIYYNHGNSGSNNCGREIFVQRTLNKWFKGKLIIWYDVSEDSNIQYCRYISIGAPYFGLGYSNDINVYYFDYANPTTLYNKIEISHNKALYLEGEWCENYDKHNQMLELTCLTIPTKEYIFERYDWDKYPKRGVSKEKALAKIRTTITFNCKTEHEAYIMKNKSEINGIGQLIEVKSII